MYLKFDIDALEPRVHGNGFIQADLPDNRRLHIWGHRNIPRQKTYTPIHDHVFDFRSTVLFGRMINMIYMRKLNPLNGKHQLWQAQPPQSGSNSYLALDDDNPICRGRWDLDLRITETIEAGDRYDMRAFMFHETVVTQPTITVMEKMGQTLVENPNGNRPYVAVPFVTQPDNEFDRHGFDKGFLLGIIKDVWSRYEASRK